MTSRRSTLPEIDRRPLLTIREVAARLSVSYDTVKRMAARGELQKVQVGGQVRFQISTIDRYIEIHSR